MCQHIHPTSSHPPNDFPLQHPLRLLDQPPQGGENVPAEKKITQQKQNGCHLPPPPFLPLSLPPKRCYLAFGFLNNLPTICADWRGNGRQRFQVALSIISAHCCLLSFVLLPRLCTSYRKLCVFLFFLCCS